MNTFPDISVVITCYNYGQYIEGCIQSVLNQTFDNFEIIVVDDGSTDNTPDIVNKYKGMPNFYYIRQANAGQANAKNTGIKNARGNFIAFLDADDLWEKSKLERQLRLFDNPKVGVVYSKSKSIDHNGNILKSYRPGKYFKVRSGQISKWLFFDNFIPFSSSVVRKECFEKLGAFNDELPMGIDWDLWLRMSTLYEFDFVNEELLYYRVGHPGQMSKNLEMRLKCSDLIMASFISDFPGVLRNSIINKSYSYTFCNRGNIYFNLDKKKSREFYIKALFRYPFYLRSYCGLIKSFIF